MKRSDISRAGLAAVLLIAAGASSQETADRLVVSVRTVEHHLTAIYRKIHVRNRAEATAYALRHGYL